MGHGDGGTKFMTLPEYLNARARDSDIILTFRAHLSQQERLMRALRPLLRTTAISIISSSASIHFFFCFSTLFPPPPPPSSSLENKLFKLFLRSRECALLCSIIILSIHVLLICGIDIFNLTRFLNKANIFTSTYQLSYLSCTSFDFFSDFYHFSPYRFLLSYRSHSPLLRYPCFDGACVCVPE